MQLFLGGSRLPQPAAPTALEEWEPYALLAEEGGISKGNDG